MIKITLKNKKNRLAKELELRSIITSLKNCMGKVSPKDDVSLELVVTEKKKELEYLQKNKEWLFNFEGGGWNSVSAKDLTEATSAIRKEYGKSEVSIPKYNTIRISTPADKKNLMSMFH